MATIADIARATRRSTATVDRVLNDRPGVREETRQLILRTAAEMGYGRAAPLALPFDILLPTTGAFMRELADHISLYAKENTSALRQVNVHFIDYDAPEALVATLLRLRDISAGVALVALDHILIREALKELIRANVPVVTLLTDISSLPHQGYVGADNRLAGRLAGHLMGRFLPRGAGRVFLLKGSAGYRGHEEREMGFRSAIREDFPYLDVPAAIEIGESAQSGLERTRRLLEQETGLAGIYNIGAGTSGIAEALQALSLDRKPVFIAHDLSRETRPHLLSGVIDVLLDQNAALVAQRALSRLREAVEQRMLGVCEVMDSRIIFKDNIPQR